MSGTMNDVRDVMLKVLRELGDPENSPEAIEQTIARAKAVSDVAQTFINSVKVEVDARNLLGDHLPAAIDETAPPRPRLVGSR
jgi:hypothetical protein